jgi:O-antigen ligase
MAGRERILPAAIGMFMERPIFGWQPVQYAYELGRRVGVAARAPHNLYLYVPLLVGLIGAVPFFAGLWLCVQAAWKVRTGNLGNIPLAAMVTVLTINLALDGLAKKPLWLVLALAFAPTARLQHRYVTRRIKMVPA